MKKSKNRSFLFIKMALPLLIALFICSFPFYSFEFLTYDARYRLTPQSKPSDLIQTISIDRKTIESLKREPTLLDHNQFLRNLIDDEPAIIVYLLDIPSLPGNRMEKTLFAQTTGAANQFIALYDGFPYKGEEKKRKLAPPFQDVLSIPGVLSADGDNFAGDGVTRRALLFAEDTVFLHPTIAAKFNGITDTNQYRGVFNFRDTKQILVNHRRANSFSNTAFSDILSANRAPGKFKDKIVLVGVDSMADTNQYFKSVYSRDAVAVSKLEVHANIIDTLINNRAVIRTPEAFDIGLTILISILTVFVVFSMKPGNGLLTIVGTLLTFSFISWALFAAFRISIGMAHPLIAIFVSYYFFIPYRLIRENRQSWEYQQKNRLLTQVEELKTNFLGMMSHDLKTPLARIQGMADIALAESTNLSISQKEALKSINKSSEELTEFISSILDLTRVESQNIKLKYESKDINQLLDQVIAKYEYLAKEKKIAFIKDFEPLFSVKVDVDLMRQVFSNLVENAIKYSPEGSKVLISTEEVGNRIMVQVADQGIGIPNDELNNVFMKFYRSSNVKNTHTKGSGLGLYLAKYFVELHKGTISVESKPQQGSTFTVGLPNV